MLAADYGGASAPRFRNKSAFWSAVIFEILNTMSHLVIAGLRAGGAMLALAADHVYARSGVVLNPHYRSMGGLHDFAELREKGHTHPLMDEIEKLFAKQNDGSIALPARSRPHTAK